MKSNRSSRWKFLIMYFLFLFFITGCTRNNSNECKIKEAPSLESADATEVDSKEINRIDDIDRLDQVISIEEIKLSAHYYESYRSSAEFLGLPEANDDKLNYKLRYKSGEYEVVGYISAPADYLENDYPVLIYNRGGNGNLGRLLLTSFVYTRIWVIS